ncbi:eCIS core domain-containing protein [Reichenbachiella sp.]
MNSKNKHINNRSSSNRSVAQDVAQRKSNNTGLPVNLKMGIEKLSGYSMDDVKVHYNSPKPAQLNAHAYAQGNNIHMASGQEKHLPHEAWHVVQQKQGRVKPTVQLKSRVNINDDPVMEKEADEMGAKAWHASNMAISSRDNLTPYQYKRRSGDDTIQLQQIEKAVTGITHLVRLVNGSLYSKDFQANEVATVGRGDKVVIDTDTRYRSRRGPNQEAHASTDEHGPQHYLWYKVLSCNRKPCGHNIYIREDTLTHPQQSSAMKHPLQGTVHGTDKASKNEIRDAYLEGQRDFDCAYSYHGGQTYHLFRSFPINNGAVRIIYKFKWGELSGAEKEIERLFRTPGVIIHTIMLHELPQNGLKKSLKQLSFLGKMYHCHIGLSNVDITPLNLETDLPNIEKQLRHFGVHLSVVENRMNPVAPDVAVRKYCLQHGIKYIAYGLSGPSQGGGTCGLVPSASTGDYAYLKDPEIEHLSKELGISPDQFRYVVHRWARRSHVSVIARSSDQTRRAANRRDIHTAIEPTGAMDYFAPTDSPIYKPFETYLLRQGIGKAEINQLPTYIEAKWLDTYYKHVVVGLGEDPLLELLKQFGKLKSAQGRNHWKDVTEMREWVTKVLTPGLPKQATAIHLFELAPTIHNSDFSSIIESAQALGKIPKGEEVTLQRGQDYTTYVSDGEGNFTQA